MGKPSDGFPLGSLGRVAALIRHSLGTANHRRIWTERMGLGRIPDQVTPAIHELRQKIESRWRGRHETSDCSRETHRSGKRAGESH